MPFVTIHLPKGKDKSFLDSLSAIVHSAMVETINCPPTTLYHNINEVDRERLVYLPEYKGLHRTDNVIILQITMKEGRTPEQKKLMYEKISLGLHERLGIRHEDLFIIVTENKAEDWYFGREGD